MSDQSDEIDQFIARSRLLNGKEVHEGVAWNTSATADAIRHFAHGISDCNPLWLDAKYAAQSRYGCLLAPPAFLTSVLYPVVHGAAIEVPLSSLVASIEYRWSRPVLIDDQLRATTRQTDLHEALDRRNRRLVFIIGETTYSNQRDEIVAVAVATTIRAPQAGAELLIDRPIHRYGENELQRIAEAARAETRTGARVLTGDDVHIGQQVPGLVRGPLTIGDLVCWRAAIGPSYRAGTLGFLDCLEAPHSAVRNPVTGGLVKPSQQHEDFLLASQRGMPAPFDNGVMRFAWVSVLMTNWIGDDGLLLRLTVHSDAPNLYGDTTWYSGTVTRKVETDTGTVITVKLNGVNQADIASTSGEAEVLLPAKAARATRIPSHQHEHHVAAAPETRSAARAMKLREVADGEPAPIHALFEAQAQRTPTALAAICDGDEITYEQLNRRANRLARRLRSLGAKPDTLIAICMQRSVDFLVAVLGVLKAGAAYVPLDLDYPKERLAYMINDSHAPLLLTHERALDKLPEHRARVVCLDSGAGDDGDDGPVSAADAANLAYVLYTSGSAGTPRAVAVTHASLSCYIGSLPAPLGVVASDTYLHTASFAFSAAVRQMFLPFSLGCTLIVASSEQRLAPLALFELMQGRRATVWDTVPTFWRHCIESLALLEQPRRTALLDNALRLILSTGETLPWDVPRRWANEIKHDARVINLYSQTETAGTVAIYPIPPTFLHEGNAGAVPLGHALEGITLHVVDERLEPVAAGATGELYVGSDRLARGYFNRPDLTAMRFMQDRFSDAVAARLYRTGDLARRLDDDSLEFVGRADRRVKLRGFRVEPEEIEGVLSGHPDVLEAAVAIRADAQGEDSLIAYVVIDPEKGLTQEALREFLAQQVPTFVLPAAFVQLPALPLLPNGKVDRRALISATDINQLSLRTPFVAPRTALEQALALIWAEVLQVPVQDIGVDDDFFGLGGHSLHITRVAARIRTWFLVELPLRELFERPTIAALATTMLASDAGNDLAGYRNLNDAFFVAGKA